MVDVADNALADLDEVKDWLNLDGTGDDDFLQRSINRWSDTVESRLNRRLTARTFEDERHDGGRLAVLLRNPPVAEITSLTVDGGALASTDYVLDEESGVVRMAYAKRFGGGNGSVLVTYRGGCETVPGDINQAVIQLVALDYYLSGHGRKALAKRGESAPGGGNVTYERGPEDQRRIMRELERRYARR